jgi:hypothetical protein
VLKMACRSRSRVAMTLSPEPAICSGMMLVSLGQSETYRVLGCVLGKDCQQKWQAVVTLWCTDKRRDDEVRLISPLA